MDTDDQHIVTEGYVVQAPPVSRDNGRSDYEQLCLAVGNYLADHGITFMNYNGQWGVTCKGNRVFFYGAGDAFSYAVSQIGKDE